MVGVGTDQPGTWVVQERRHGNARAHRAMCRVISALFFCLSTPYSRNVAQRDGDMPFLGMLCAFSAAVWVSFREPRFVVNRKKSLGSSKV